jgi:hypothetical protein
MPNVESLADYYRRRAAQERALGAGVGDQGLRRSHFEAAERYEQLALAAPNPIKNRTDQP